MSQLHEQPPSDGPEFMTVEQARQELRDDIAMKYKDSIANEGVYGLEQLEELLLADDEEWRVHVDKYNELIQIDWEIQQAADQSGIERWSDEGGSDPID